MNRLILVGRAGVGKSTVRHELAQRLGWQSIGPDDHDTRWGDIYRVFDYYPCVLECCGIPRAIRRRLDDDVKVVELTAPEHVRRDRLRRQGLGENVVTERLAQPHSIGYEDTIVPDMTVDTTSSPTSVVDRILGSL